MGICLRVNIFYLDTFKIEKFKFEPAKLNSLKFAVHKIKKCKK